jgi:hypothetical protein
VEIFVGRAILRDLPLVDEHLDLVENAILFGRNLTQNGESWVVGRES